MSGVALVLPYWSDITKSEMIEFGKLAEDLCYHSIWMPEMWGRDVISIIALLIANTEQIKFGTGIISVYSRTPALIAQTVATLDEVSGGRMMLGLGTSGRAVIEDWHGLEFDKPLKRTRETIDIIRKILNFERVNYEGEVFNLKNFKLQFKPLRSDVPIIIAALGPKNIQLTGEIADGWLPYFVPIDRMPLLVEDLEKAATDAGRDKDSVFVSPYITACVSENTELAKDLVREHIAYYIGSMGDYYKRVISDCGFESEVDEIISLFRNKDRKGAISHVSDDMLDSLSIAGDPSSVKSKLMEYRNGVCDLPILLFPPKTTREMVRESMIALRPD